MQWHYVLNGATLGPVDEAGLRRLHEQGTVTDETPVWCSGMTEWLPFQSSALSTAAPGQLVPKHLCAECGKAFAEDEMLHYEQKWVCAACKPIFFQRLKEGVKAQGALDYASVGRRFLAIILDAFILFFLIILLVGIPMMLFLVWNTSADKTHSPIPIWLTLMILVFEYAMPAAFEIYFIGKYGATPGKMIMSIRVVTPEGGPITYGRSTGRYFAKILSGIILYIGFLMAFWDEEKRALHDQLCNTRVINVR